MRNTTDRLRFELELELENLAKSTS